MGLLYIIKGRNNLQKNKRRSSKNVRIFDEETRPFISFSLVV